MPFLLPILGVLLGSALIVTGFVRRPWSRVRSLTGAAMICGVVALVADRERVYAHVDLNPPIPGSQSLVGMWQLDGTVLALSPTGDWECVRPEGRNAPCGLETRRGRWSLDEFRRVELRDASGARVLSMPVIADRGVYRLLPNSELDPDSWDVSTGYERIASPSR